MKNNNLPAAIMWDVTVRRRMAYPTNKLTCRDGQIENWPNDIVGPRPTEAEQALLVADYEAAGKPLHSQEPKRHVDLAKLEAWAITMGYVP